ncbi:hypothetical protein BDB01DRAFT_28505 [Pilobolus umbonatus]|nr:hypothetical protein BDB01DRAFT_28505 [Pilobolus umbonatus]
MISIERGFISTRPNLPVSDEVDEPSGDELDDISARDIAMARYKRNHDYLSEIFTPYNASSILPPPLDISQSKEELKKQIDQYKERTQSDNVRCKERIASLEKEYSLFWQKMNDLNEANSLESIEDATRSLSKDMNSVVEHNPHNVKILSIPDVNDDELMDMSIHDKDNENGNHGQMEIDGKENEDQKDEYIQYSDKDGVDSMDMYFDQIEDTNDDSANDFFNDMVNTEDDPSDI